MISRLCPNDLATVQKELAAIRNRPVPKAFGTPGGVALRPGPTGMSRSPYQPCLSSLNRSDAVPLRARSPLAFVLPSPLRTPGCLADEEHFDESRDKEFAAARVFPRDPDRYLLIVSVLAVELLTRWICRAFKVSHYTVQAIRERELQDIATEKRPFAGKHRVTSRDCVERLIDALEYFDPKDLREMQSLGVLDGKATAIGEKLKGDILDEIGMVFQDLPRSDEAIDLETINSTG